MSYMHSNTTLYNCVKCSKQFKTRHSLDSHMKTHQIVLIYVCKKCEKCFNEFNLYENHKLMCNNEDDSSSLTNNYIDEEYLNSSDSESNKYVTDTQCDEYIFKLILNYSLHFILYFI